MRQRGIVPTGDHHRLGKLLDLKDDRLSTNVVRLAGLWRVESLRPQLAEYAQQPATSASLRQTALESLAALGGPASRQTIERLANPGSPVEIRMASVKALTALDLPAAARKAVDVLTVANTETDPSELFAAFLERKNGAEALVVALAGQKLSADVAKAGIRAARISGRDNPALIATLTKVGSLTSVPRALSPAELRQMVVDVSKHGDPARGEVVFRRKDQACLKCHAIAGAGGQVGPDLASIGASAPVDYVIESILLPNKAIKENYHSLVVTTKEGRFFTGIKIRETDSELILRNADDQEIAVPVKAIDEKATGASLMPDGLADTLTRAELVDLVRFLSELGKVGPYSVSKARLARRWQALEPTKEAYSLLQRTSFASAAATPAWLPWSPLYSQVSGVLPLEALPSFEFRKPDSREMERYGFVRCQVESSNHGKVKLLLNSVTGLTGWLDDKPIDLSMETPIDLAPGVHTITFAVNLKERRDGLRCELEDAAGSAARARILTGK